MYDDAIHYVIIMHLLLVICLIVCYLLLFICVIVVYSVMVMLFIDGY